MGQATGDLRPVHESSFEGQDACDCAVTAPRKPNAWCEPAFAELLSDLRTAGPRRYPPVLLGLPPSISSPGVLSSQTLQLIPGERGRRLRDRSASPGAATYRPLVLRPATAIPLTSLHSQELRAGDWC